MRTKSLFATLFNLHGWCMAGRDTLDGFVASARLGVSLVGAATLSGAVALAGLPVARAAVARWWPQAGPGWQVPFDPAGPVASAAAANGNQTAGAEQAADDDQDGAADDGPVKLDARLAHVASYLARRYHVADEPVREMVAAAQAAGNDNQVDPLLVLAVVAVESGMNPVAQSPVGAQGLMQVMTRMHSALFEAQGGDEAALDPEANIKVGTAILGDLIRRAGSVERGLQLYVGAGAGTAGAGSWYAARVRAELDRLRQAAAVHPQDALARGRHPQLPAAEQPAQPAAAQPAAVQPELRADEPGPGAARPGAGERRQSGNGAELPS